MVGHSFKCNTPSSVWSYYCSPKPYSIETLANYPNLLHAEGNKWLYNIFRDSPMHLSLQMSPFCPFCSYQQYFAVVLWIIVISCTELSLQCSCRSFTNCNTKTFESQLFHTIKWILVCSNFIKGKEAAQLLQSLNKLNTPEEKLEVLAKKYAELVSAEYFAHFILNRYIYFSCSGNLISSCLNWP